MYVEDIDDLDELNDLLDDAVNRIQNHRAQFGDVAADRYEQAQWDYDDIQARIDEIEQEQEA